MGKDLSVRLLPLDMIDDTPYRTRDVVEDEAMRDLVDSVKTVGILEPLIVCPDGEDRFALIAGHRRYYAARLAGLRRAPCIVGDWDRSVIDRIRLDENALRVDLTAVEEGELFRSLISTRGLKVVDVARLLGRSAPYVSQRLSLLEADPEIIQAVRDRRLSFAVARELQAIRDDDKRRYYTRWALDNGASQRTVRRWREQADLDIRRDACATTGVTASDHFAPGGGSTENGDPPNQELLSQDPDQDGYFRCVCGAAGHVSTGAEFDGLWRCAACVMQMRAIVKPDDDRVCCSFCGAAVGPGRYIKLIACSECSRAVSE